MVGSSDYSGETRILLMISLQLNNFAFYIYHVQIYLDFFIFDIIFLYL